MSAHTYKHLLGTFIPLRSISILQLQMIHILLTRCSLLWQNRSKQIKILDKFLRLTCEDRVLHYLSFWFIFTQGQSKGQLETIEKKNVNMLLLWAESWSFCCVSTLPKMTADFKANVTQCILQFNSLPTLKFCLKALNLLIITLSSKTLWCFSKNYDKHS